MSSLLTSEEITILSRNRGDGRYIKLLGIWMMLLNEKGGTRKVIRERHKFQINGCLGMGED